MCLPAFAPFFYGSFFTALYLSAVCPFMVTLFHLLHRKRQNKDPSNQAFHRFFHFESRYQVPMCKRFPLEEFSEGAWTHHRFVHMLCVCVHCPNGTTYGSQIWCSKVVLSGHILVYSAYSRHCLRMNPRSEHISPLVLYLVNMSSNPNKKPRAGIACCQAPRCDQLFKKASGNK